MTGSVVPKVAIITGGASGIGLEVAKRLSERESWTLHLFDVNETAGVEAAMGLPGATFHNVDVSSYDSLSSAFHNVYRSSRRLDFVFANAGIFEKANFYEGTDAASPSPPPEPKWPGIDINLKGAINTCYLARHYFRVTEQKDGALVITASCVGLYPSEYSPRYSASKAGVLNFMRAIAPAYFDKDRIRTYAVLPGAVKTNFLDPKDWPPYPENYFTPTSKIASTVEGLVYGELTEDSVGKQVSRERNFGLAVEVNCDRVYFRDQPEYCDKIMATVMGVVTVESQEKLAKNGQAKHM